MAELVDCGRCGRRFVADRAERVAGALVCPGCAPEAKQEAAAAAAAKSRRPCDGCGKRLDPEFLTRRYGKSLCAECLATGAGDPSAQPAVTTTSASLCPRPPDPTRPRIRKRSLILAGTALGLLALLGAVYLWRARPASGHLRLGKVDTALAWFREHDAHPPVRFNPDQAETGVLCGREFLVAPVYLDATKPPTVKLFFDKARNVWGASFHLPSPNGGTDASWPGPVAVLRGKRWHPGYFLAEYYMKAFVQVDLYPFTYDGPDDPFRESRRAQRDADWRRIANPVPGEPGMELVSFSCERRGIFSEILFWQETKPDGNILDSMILVRAVE